jgi:hypothetical protein
MGSSITENRTAVAIDPENSSAIWVAAGRFGGTLDESVDGGTTSQITLWPASPRAASVPLLAK